MYQKIKELADNALKLQNKDVMHNALVEISNLCSVKDNEVPEIIFSEPFTAKNKVRK